MARSLYKTDFSLILVSVLIVSFGLAEEIESEAESSSEVLVTEGSDNQARFLPFSASFAVNTGGSNTQSFSISGGPNGIGLAQSSSLGSSGNSGSVAASQASALAAGPNGISAAGSNAFAANNPYLGHRAQAHGNSFSVGDADASADAHASASAQHFAYQRPNHYPSYPGGSYGGYYDNYNYHNRPANLHVSVTDGDRQHYRPGLYERPDPCRYAGWDPRCPSVVISKPGPYYPEQRPGYYGDYNNQNYYGRPGGLSLSLGEVPSDPTLSKVEISSNAQADTNIDLSALNRPSQIQASITSSIASAMSNSNGAAQGISSAGSSSGVTNSGASSSSNAASIGSSTGETIVGPEQIIPPEFIRIQRQKKLMKHKSKNKKDDDDDDDDQGPVETIISEIADAVEDIFDY